MEEGVSSSVSRGLETPTADRKGLNDLCRGLEKTHLRSVPSSLRRMVNDIYRISWELVVIIMVALVDAGENDIDNLPGQ